MSSVGVTDRESVFVRCEVGESPVGCDSDSNEGVAVDVCVVERVLRLVITVPPETDPNDTFFLSVNDPLLPLLPLLNCPASRARLPPSSTVLYVSPGLCAAPRSRDVVEW